MAGCYFRVGSGAQSYVIISRPGLFKYGNQSTAITAYEDKQGLSLLPEREVVASKEGGLDFLRGQPFILRIDNDRLGFIVPSRTGDWSQFRKGEC